MKRRGGILIGDGGGGAGGVGLPGDGGGGFALTARRPRGRCRVVSHQGVAEIGYTTFETSPFLGDPVEGFEFTMGPDTYRYTSSAPAATFLGQTFAPEKIARTAMEFSQEDQAGNITISVPKGNAVAQLFVAFLPPFPVAIIIYRKHRPDDEVHVEFVGKVMSVTFEGAEARMVCAPVRSLLQKKVPGVVFQSQCNHNLYGIGCGVLKAAFKVTGTVVSISGSTLTAVVFGTKPDGWFNNGWVELAGGERRFIVSHVGTTVELMNRFVTLTPGTSFDAYPGCDRTETVCREKFNNLPRHLGFARIPTRNPYDGSLV